MKLGKVDILFLCLQGWVGSWAEQCQGWQWAKDSSAHLQLSASPQVLQGGTLQRTISAVPCLLVVVCPSFPRLEFKVQVSALTLASPLLHLGKSRSASCWLQWGSGSRTSRGLAQLSFLSLRSYLGSIFWNCSVGLQTLVIYINEALSGCFQQLNLCVINLG